MENPDHPRFADALARGGVLRQVPATDGPTALRAIVAALKLPAHADREALLALLIERQAMRSTVGDGIAIPHVHSTTTAHGCQAAIATCFLATPLDCGAHDGLPVNTVFMLTSPTAGAHLHLLSHLASALHDPGFREVVLGRADEADILREAQRFEANFRR